MRPRRRWEPGGTPDAACRINVKRFIQLIADAVSTCFHGLHRADCKAVALRGAQIQTHAAKSRAVHTCGRQIHQIFMVFPVGFDLKAGDLRGIESVRVLREEIQVRHRCSPVAFISTSMAS